MPTLPDVAEKPGAAPPQRAALQALLVAARAEASVARRPICVDTLKKARELLERAK